MILKIRKVLLKAAEIFSRRNVIAPIILLVTASCISASAFYFETEEEKPVIPQVVVNVPQMDTDEMLESIGSEMGELDVTVVSKTEDGKVEVQVMPAGIISVTADGATKEIPVRYDDTVEQAFVRGEITVGELDIVSCEMDSVVEYDSEITVVRVAVSEVTETIEIPFEEETRKNSEKYTDYKAVVQQGANGKKEKVTKITTHDGVVVSRDVVSEDVITEPVNKVTEIGTKTIPNVVAGNGTITSRDGTLRYSKVLEVMATAYSTENTASKLTCTGETARVGLIAVDPKVIPLGTRMYITSPDGKSWIYGYAVAADTGGAIKGNKIDLFFNTEKECNRFGRRKALVYILE